MDYSLAKKSSVITASGIVNNNLATAVLSKDVANVAGPGYKRRAKVKCNYVVLFKHLHLFSNYRI